MTLGSGRRRGGRNRSLERLTRHSVTIREQPTQFSLHEGLSQQPADEAERQFVLDRILRQAGIGPLRNHPVDVLPEMERACDLHIGETAPVPIVAVLELPFQSKRPGTHQQRNAGAILDATFVSEHTHRFPRRGQSLKRARGFMPVKDGFGRGWYQSAGKEGDAGGCAASAIRWPGTVDRIASAAHRSKPFAVRRVLQS